jgi:hypothetical protein
MTPEMGQSKIVKRVLPSGASGNEMMFVNFFGCIEGLFAEEATICLSP